MPVGQLLRKLLQPNEDTSALQYLSHIGGCHFVKIFLDTAKLLRIGMDNGNKELY